MFSRLVHELKEALFSILPVYLIIIILSFTPLISLDYKEIGVFSLSVFFLILGMSLFTLGANISLRPIGHSMGVSLTKQGNLWILLVFTFFIGFLATIAEPDLSILANQTKELINPIFLMVIIGLGVGLFLIIGILKVVHRVQLSNLLTFFYFLVFSFVILAFARENEELIGVAFDSGGVTTGSITVPFLMALGVGVSSVLSKKVDKDASFGFVALCSIGPILIMLILSLFFVNGFDYQIPDYGLNKPFFQVFFSNLLEEGYKLIFAILSIFIMFLICNFLFLHLEKEKVLKLGIGIIYTYVGLVIFLASANTGLVSMGFKIGIELSNKGTPFLLVFGFILGCLVCFAEPAVHVLKLQVEEITGGLIKKNVLLIALSIGTGISIFLSLLRIVLNFNIVYYLVFGYLIALGLSFFIPKIYTAIAFDSGGVASGVMTTTFILPLSLGACNYFHGNDSILSLGFGVVAMVALTPLISIELLGFIAIIKDKRRSKRAIRNVLKEKDNEIIRFERKKRV